MDYSNETSIKCTCSRVFLCCGEAKVRTCVRSERGVCAHARLDTRHTVIEMGGRSENYAYWDYDHYLERPYHMVRPTGDPGEYTTHYQLIITILILQ